MFTLRDKRQLRAYLSNFRWSSGFIRLHSRQLQIPSFQDQRDDLISRAVVPRSFSQSSCPSAQDEGLPGLHVKAHFVVQSGSVVHWRQKNREKKEKKRKKIDKRNEKQKEKRERSEKIVEIQSIFYAILSFLYQFILFRQLFLSCSQALSCTG